MTVERRPEEDREQSICVFQAEGSISKCQRPGTHARCVQETAGRLSRVKYGEREKRWGQRQVLGKGDSL